MKLRSKGGPLSMAELLIKVGHGAGYEDGDVLCAFNRRQIRCAHAEHLCHLDGAGFNGHGLRPMHSLARDLRESCCQFRFERVSRWAIERVDISTGERETLTGPEFNVSINGRPVVYVSFPEIRKHREYHKRPASQVAALVACLREGFQSVLIDKQSHKLTIAGVETPYSAVPANPEQMDVEQWLRRRMKHDRHAIFGEATGSEFWYGGRSDFSHPKLDKVWNAIQTKTPRLESEAEFGLWPMGRLDIRHHLAIRVEDFDDAESDGLVRPLMDGESLIAKRNIKVNWRTDLLDDLMVTEVEVLDREKPIGRDVAVAANRFRYESKSQPVQSDRTKLVDKQTGGRVQPKVN